MNHHGKQITDKYYDETKMRIILSQSFILSNGHRCSSLIGSVSAWYAAGCGFEIEIHKIAVFFSLAFVARSLQGH